MNKLEQTAWHAFRDVCKEFLGKHQKAHRKCIVENLIKCYQNLVEIYICGGTFPLFLSVFFSRECEDVSDEHGEKFNQDIP